MPVTPTADRIVIDGRPHWKYPDGQVLPAIFGGSPEGDDRTDPAAEEAATAAAQAEREAQEAAAAEAARKAAEEKAAAEAAAAEAALGDAGKRALDNERAAKEAAEKKAKEEAAARAAAEAKVKEYEDAQLSEDERLKKQAEEGVKAREEGVRLVREAKLLTALTAHGLPGGQAKAAAKLLDGVEYDAAHEPTNLEAAIEKATAVYGATPFTLPEPPRDPPPTPRNNGGGEGKNDPPPALTADELKAAETAGMSPERFAALKDGASLEDWQRMQAAASQ